MFSSVGFFTAAGGVYHSLVRRLWCRWFILNELLSQKRGEAEERALSEEGREAKPEMNAKSKRRLEALSRRYPGKLELRVPQGATPVYTLRMQALTAVRYDDILAHVTFLRGRVARIAVCVSLLLLVWDLHCTHYRRSLCGRKRATATECTNERYIYKNKTITTRTNKDVNMIA